MFKETASRTISRGRCTSEAIRARSVPLLECVSHGCPTFWQRRGTYFTPIFMALTPCIPLVPLLEGEKYKVWGEKLPDSQCPYITFWMKKAGQVGQTALVHCFL